MQDFLQEGGGGIFEIVNVQIHVHGKQMGIVGMQNIPRPEKKGKMTGLTINLVGYVS